MANIINNKEKQNAGGNWGHPRKFTKRHTKIPNPLVPERPRSKKKKNKTPPTPYFSPYQHCPFCKIELLKKKNSKYGLSMFRRENFCRKCDAKEIDDGCPACHRDIWIKGGFHKHIGFINCGFSGKKFNPKEIEVRKGSHI